MTEMAGVVQQRLVADPRAPAKVLPADADQSTKRTGDRVAAAAGAVLVGDRQAILRPRAPEQRDQAMIEDVEKVAQQRLFSRTVRMIVAV